jgi:hypothetical protein
LVANTSYTVQVEQDIETGELVLPLPVDMLSQLGWSEGIDLFWVDNEDGTFTITDKKNGTGKSE